MNKLNKKYTRRLNKKKRTTTRRVRIKRVKKGGHTGENLRHYHLKVLTPQNKSIELSELFAESGKAITKEGKEIDVKSQTIRDLKKKIIDNESGSSWDFTLNKPKPSWIMVPDNSGNTKPFTLFWKGKALLDDNMKLREIYERLPLYRHSKEIEPIVIVLDEDLEYPSVVETERVKNEDFEDTPPDE